jgi:hypothetical protein
MAGRPNSGCELIFLLPEGQRLGCSRQMVSFEATGKGGFKPTSLRFVAAGIRTKVTFYSSFYSVLLCGLLLDRSRSCR